MIGIIGFGRFGALTARYLARDFSVKVLDSGTKATLIQAAGAEPADLATVCGQRILIFCVPISAMRETIARAAPLIGPQTLVVDVCSVKVAPVAWMRDGLPESVPILATHPMFGPDSAAESLEGRKIVLCPERIEAARYDRIRGYLQSRGLVVIEASAEAHDRQIAVSLALTHFIGRSLAAFGAKPLEIDTEGYSRLLHILGVVEHDTWQLFEDMHRYNPYAADQRRAFTRAMDGVEDRLRRALEA